ncbi:hypothetical protein VTG60DRAFT_6497 [Thermothelomyces hinnuleus]
MDLRHIHILPQFYTYPEYRNGYPMAWRAGDPQRAPKRVLLLTNSEHGQANVFHATAYALFTLEDEDEGVEVHVASFPRIQRSVAETSEQAQRDRPGPRPIVFHAIEGKDMRSPVPLVDVVRRTLVLLKVTLPWTGPEFVQIMHSVAGIVRDVQPDITAARSIILTPNTIKEFVVPLQPNAEALWRYPWNPLPVPAAAVGDPAQPAAGGALAGSDAAGPAPAGAGRLPGDGGGLGGSLRVLCKRSDCGRVVAARHIPAAIEDGRPPSPSAPGERGEKEIDPLLDGGSINASHAAR